jgi:shikimate dehydrogenase
MVTIPHKEKVLELCDSLHESARLMGAANLLEFTSDGRIVGHSSDGWAALRSLDEEGVSYAGKNVVILGGGGAARSLALTFAHAGVARIALLNRTLSRADAIAAEVIAQGVPAITGIPEGQDMRQIMEDCELLVNATSVGMTPEVDRTPVAREFLRPGLAVYDIVYNPLETRLLREARQAGARPVDGLGMLIYTNVYAVQTCAAGTISASVMRQEALKALAERSH